MYLQYVPIPVQSKLQSPFSLGNYSKEGELILDIVRVTHIDIVTLHSKIYVNVHTVFLTPDETTPSAMDGSSGAW